MIGSNVNELRPGERLDWFRSLPFFFVHLVGIGGLFFVTISPVDLWVGLARFLTGIVIVTGFYHRYFSHRAFQTSRPFQFLMALGCVSTLQKPPTWWAANHRHHHQHSDQEDDVHSWLRKGFWLGMWWSHVGWILCPKFHRTDENRVKDWFKFPELRWLDCGGNHLYVPAALAVGLYLWGGWSMLVVGFFTSTVALWHVTFSINSFAHKIGRQRYVTRDQSRNSWFLAILTCGEGWHNNHHHHAASARQGFYWWEVDVTYYVLKLLSWTGLIWDLNPVPEHAKNRNLVVTPKPAPG